MLPLSQKLEYKVTGKTRGKLKNEKQHKMLPTSREAQIWLIRGEQTPSNQSVWNYS